MKRLDAQTWRMCQKGMLVGLLFLTAIHFGLSQDVINLSANSADSEYPAIAVNHRGEVLVVWTEDGNVFYRFFRNGVWSGTANAGLRVQFAAITQLDEDSQGKFHVSYSDGYSSGSRDIFYSMFSPGNGWGEPERINYDNLNSAWNRIAVDGNEVFVMWFQEVGGGSEAEIVLNSKSIGGSWSRSWENVSRNPYETSIHPAFDVKDGNVYSCYMAGTESAWDIVFSERVQGYWQTPEQIGDGHWPGLCVDDNHNVFAVFYSSSGNRLYFRERINGSWHDLEDLNTRRAEKGFSDVKVKNNVVVAAWSQATEYGSSIYYCYKVVGSGWAEAQELDRGNQGYYPLIALDDEGNAHFVWEDIGVGGRRDILYRKVYLVEPNAPFIQTDRSFLSFSASQGDSPSQVVRIKNGGVGQLNYTITVDKSWLSVTPQAGFSKGDWNEIVVTAKTSNLNAGNHTGTISLLSQEAMNSPKTISVSLKVIDASPRIQLSTDSFTVVAVDEEQTSDVRTLRVRNSGGRTLQFTVASDRPWIAFSPKSGSSSGAWTDIVVTVNTSSLAVGQYSGRLTVNSPDANNSPQRVAVELEVRIPPYPYQPVNAQVDKVDRVGLFIKRYINRIQWENNPKNRGNFAIAKYLIFRKEMGQSDESLVYLTEVDGGQSLRYEDEFSSLKERDAYAYAVAAVDSLGKESRRTSAFPLTPTQNSSLLNKSNKIGGFTPRIK